MQIKRTMAEAYAYLGLHTMNLKKKMMLKLQKTILRQENSILLINRPRLTSHVKAEAPVKVNKL
jgi:hypothetical protein